MPPLSLVLLGVAFLLLLAAVHPFVTYPLSLMVLRRLRPRPLTAPANDHVTENFALCVCAYNEEAVIRDKVENMLDLRRTLGGELEILVYVDAASDRTAEILREYRNRITLVVSPERRGKTHGMNLLAGMAKAPLLVFTDANVMVDRQALPNLRTYFADPTVGCVCGHLIYVNGKTTATAETGSLYWKLEEFIKQLETDTGSAMGADGSLFAIRSRLHRAVPTDAIDDMFLSFNILCDGYRVVRAPDVLAYEQTATVAGEEFRRKIRIAAQSFFLHRRLWPRLSRLDGINLYKYVSHKLLRWITIYNLAGAGVFGLAGIALSPEPQLAANLIAAGTVGFLLAWRLKLRPVPQVADILMAFLATGIGVWRSLRGARFQTWTPAASVRSFAQPVPANSSLSPSRTMRS